MTWRQKDLKEPDLGLYGKNKRNIPIDLSDSNEFYHVSLSDAYDNTEIDRSIEKSKFIRPNIANTKNVFNSVWKTELSKLKRVLSDAYMKHIFFSVTLIIISNKRVHKSILK